MIMIVYRFLGLALIFLLSGCSWFDDPGPGGTNSLSSVSSLPSINGGATSSQRQQVIDALKQRASQREADVNYSDIIDPTRAASAQISPTKHQQINDLILNGGLSSVADEISRCSKNVSSTGTSSGCSTSSIQKSIDNLSKKTSKSSSKFSDKRVKKNFEVICSQCQYQPKSKQICVLSKTPTQQCPTCGQITNEIKSYNQIAKYMRQTNMTFSDNTVNCNNNMLRHSGSQQHHNNLQSHSKIRAKH